MIIQPGKQETSEIEFTPRHPDIFSSYLAAQVVLSLAERINTFGGQTALERYRADLHVQIKTSDNSPDHVTPIIISLAGQVNLPREVSLDEVVYEEAGRLLTQARYDPNEFRISEINLAGVTVQSPNLNGTTHVNAYADSAKVHGHYIVSPIGRSRTFPSLIYAQAVNSAIDSFLVAYPNILRPDGKVHVTGTYAQKGFQPERVFISLSHAPGTLPRDVSEIVVPEISRLFTTGEYQLPDVLVNDAGPFDVYFVRADAGTSKAKDAVMISGGNGHQSTDGIWGKGLFKASSVLFPYTFALSRVICDVTGAQFVSVSAYGEYGQRDAHLIQVEAIDPACVSKIDAVNAALKRMPHDRDTIRQLLNMPVTIETYRQFNDIDNFHGDNPWKNPSKELYSHFRI